MSNNFNLSQVPNTPFSFRNKIINGNFDIWQRGTSQTTIGYHSADRWTHVPLGAATFASSRQTLAADEIYGTTYVDSIDIISSSAVGDGFILAQLIEDVRTLAGKTITVSFIASSNANESIAIEMEQNFGSGGSPSTAVQVTPVKVALTTTLTRYSVTIALPSITGKTIGTNGDSKLALNIWLSAGSNYNARTDTLGHNLGTFNLTQIQVEEGSVATPFEFRPQQVELALCQRYFQPIVGSVGRIDSTTNQATFGVKLSPVMRGSPAAVAVSTTIIHEMGIAFRNATSIVSVGLVAQGGYVRFAMSTSGTSGNLCEVGGGIYADAEL